MQIKITKKLINCLLAFSLVFVILFMNCTSTMAAYMDRETNGNKKEQQLLEKIRVIHSIFPQQTDEAALYATLAHRGYLTDYVNDSYDKDFDADKFRENWTGFKSSTEQVPNSIGGLITNKLVDIGALFEIFIELPGAAFTCLTAGFDLEEHPEGGKSLSDFSPECIVKTIINKEINDPAHSKEENIYNQATQPQSVDLLTAATIVMLDSSGWFGGSYSDDKYATALAGEGLIGNMVEDDDAVGKFFASVFNATFCTVGAAADVTASNITTVDSFANYDEMGTKLAVAETKKLSRYYTMTRICSRGYIGGIYQSVQNLKDGEKGVLYQPQKEKIAEEIIGLAKELRGEEKGEECIPSAGTMGTSGTWKQADSQWADISMGSTNMANSGCLVTSIAMQIARSGTHLKSLPSDYTEFNPGAFVTAVKDNGGFTSDGSFIWESANAVAGSWNSGYAKEVSISDTATLAKVIGDELSTPAEDQYQKYIVLQIRHDNSSQHWVAVDKVENNQVYILDPGSPTGNTLDDNYTGWEVYSYRVMYATDVKFGETGSSTSSDSENACGSFKEMADLLAYLEGVSMCNYKGRGENTGYSVSTLPNDPGGATTAFGLTKWDEDLAKQVGYDNYVNDLYSGCTDKDKVDMLLPATWDEMKKIALERAEPYGLTFNSYELDALASVAYGGPYSDSLTNIYAKMQQYGKDSFEAFHCFISYGCSFSNGSYIQGLTLRRMVEYELFRTGNYKAAKPYKDMNAQLAISNKAELEEYMKTHWPTDYTQELS